MKSGLAIILLWFFLILQFRVAAQYYTISVETSPESCTKGSAVISVDGGEAPFQFNWNDGEQGRERSDLFAGNYQVTIIDKAGRDTSITVSIERKHCPVFVSEVFTPNGDGIHDELSISNIYLYPNFKFEVFNRWGQRVHVQEKQFIPWDGKQFGVKLPDESYYYIFYYDAEKKDEIKTGSISILR
jgi:gliding motility-associated-like protein